MVGDWKNKRVVDYGPSTIDCGCSVVLVSWILRGCITMRVSTNKIQSGTILVIGLTRLKSFNRAFDHISILQKLLGNFLTLLAVKREVG